MATGVFLSILLLAFLCEYMDSSLGMGYGTTLAPVLLLFGFAPLQIVPVILISEFLSGFSAALLHHSFKNVDLKLGSRDFKIAAIMSLCSVVGVIAAVFVAVNIPKVVLKSIIGIIVMSMGIILIAMRGRHVRFSWTKITFLGLVAAFNKGLSGGGYGPLTTSGQVLSGVPTKSAIGITSLAESITCVAGVITYLLTKGKIDLVLAPPLLIGAMLSVPLATLSVKLIDTEKIKFLIGVLTAILGAVTLIDIFI